MRATKVRNPAGLDRLEPGRAERSEVGAGQVRVRLHASSLNYRDDWSSRAFFLHPTGAFRCVKADG